MDSQSSTDSMNDNEVLSHKPGSNTPSMPFSIHNPFFQWSQIQLNPERVKELKISSDDTCVTCKRKYSDPETNGACILLPCYDTICHTCRQDAMYEDAMSTEEAVSDCWFCRSKILAWTSEQGTVDFVHLNAIRGQKDFMDYFNMIFTVIKHLLVETISSLKIGSIAPALPSSVKSSSQFFDVLKLVQKHDRTMQRIRQIALRFMQNNPVLMNATTKESEKEEEEEVKKETNSLPSFLLPLNEIALLLNSSEVMLLALEYEAETWRSFAQLQLALTAAQAYRAPPLSLPNTFQFPLTQTLPLPEKEVKTKSNEASVSKPCLKRKLNPNS